MNNQNIQSKTNADTLHLPNELFSTDNLSQWEKDLYDEYWNKITTAIGGSQNVQDFVRLFLTLKNKTRMPNQPKELYDTFKKSFKDIETESILEKMLRYASTYKCMIECNCDNDQVKELLQSLHPYPQTNYFVLFVLYRLYEKDLNETIQILNTIIRYLQLTTTSITDKANIPTTIEQTMYDLLNRYEFNACRILKTQSYNENTTPKYPLNAKDIAQFLSI